MFCISKNGARSVRRSIAAAAVLAGALYVAAPAKAALLISISDSTDGGSASATNGTASVLPTTSFTLMGGAFGPVGNPDLTYSPILASSDSPGTAGGAQVTLDHIKITNSSNVAQVVSITVADTDYNAPGGAGSTLSLFGSFSGTPDLGISGLSSGTVSMSSYADPLDGPNASQSPVGTTTVTSSAPPLAFNTIPGSFAGGTPVAMFTRSSTPPGLYSLAGVTTVTLAPGSILDLNNDTVTFATTVVPEPTSLGLLAVGGLLAMRRRRAAR